MSNIDMTKIHELAEKFEFDVENVKKDLKRIQSIKCRLVKQKHKENYEIEMSKVLIEEQLLKEVRRYIVPEKITVTTMSLEQIKELNYDETIKAIKSIQSKKCNTQYLTEKLEENVEYQEALRIEKMLLEHKKTVRPIDETVVKKSQIDNLIENLEQLKDLDKEHVLEMLRNLKG